MTLYSPYGVEVKPDGGSTVLIGGVTDQSIDTGVQVNAEVTAGAGTPQYGEISLTQVGGRFSCHDIVTLLSAIGFRGACLTGGAGVGFGLYSLKKEACGTLSSGSVHRKMVIPNGRIVPVSLSVQQGRRASLVCQVFGLYDGTNLPLIVTANVAAPTGLADAFGFHLGVMQIAGVTLTNVTGLEINFGNTVNPVVEDGEIYAKQIDVPEHKPTITISTNNPDKFGGANITLTGKRATHANSSMVLRRRLNGTGAFSTSADHINLTMDGVAHYREFSASGNNPWTASVMITGLDDGTNDPIVADYAHSLT
jgi:hypothetical protein